ncbi:hypothetical protein D9M73_191150 [compost metagenome]
MLHTGLFPDMVFADALQLPGVPAIDPTVAYVGEGKALPAQDQGAEGGQQRLSAAVGLQPAVLRQQQAIKCLCDAPGFRRGVVIQRQGLQRRTGSQTAIDALADTVGNREQVTLARGQRRSRRDQAQGILVFLARTDGAGFGETQLQAHRGVRLALPSRRPNPRWFSSAASRRAGRTRPECRGWRTTTAPVDSCRCSA